MEFRDLVRRRRMVRAYRLRPVPPETVERILRVARRAPSAGFSQGQSFVVVTDQGLRRAIAALAGEDDYRARAFQPWLSAAPVHVVICADEGAYRRRYAAADKKASDPGEWPVPYPLVDAGASLMLLLLAATDEGLATGFLGAHRLEGIETLLGIPDDVRPIGLVTMGHPAPDRRSGSLRAGWRPPEEVIHWEGWAGRRPT